MSYIFFICPFVEKSYRPIPNYLDLEVMFSLGFNELLKHCETHLQIGIYKFLQGCLVKKLNSNGAIDCFIVFLAFRLINYIFIIFGLEVFKVVWMNQLCVDTWIKVFFGEDIENIFIIHAVNLHPFDNSLLVREEPIRNHIFTEDHSVRNMNREFITDLVLLRRRVLGSKGIGRFCRSTDGRNLILSCN